jgi:hypothetical protein
MRHIHLVFRSRLVFPLEMEVKPALVFGALVLDGPGQLWHASSAQLNALLWCSAPLQHLMERVLHARGSCWNHGICLILLHPSQECWQAGLAWST